MSTAMAAGSPTREPPLPTDEELVRRIRAGGRADFEALMRRYDQRVYRVIRSLLRSEAEVEDAMQAAWLQVWRRIWQVEDAARVGAWIARVAASEALGRLRQRRREAQDPLPEGPGELRSGEDLEGQAGRRELVRLVEGAVDRLSPEQRSAFLLRDVEGLDGAATAAALGVTSLTVKVRLHRARRRLRAELGAAVGLAPAAFRFEAPRCGPMIARVLARIALEAPPASPPGAGPPLPGLSPGERRRE